MNKDQYKIYFVTFGYFSQQVHYSLYDVKQHARQCGYQSIIYKNDTAILSFSILNQFIAIDDVELCPNS